MSVPISYPDGWRNQDDVVRADAFWSKLPCGTFVESSDGRIWTVCYRNLDGFGVVLGHRPEIASMGNDALPVPEALLREPHPSADWECIGEYVRVIS